AVDLPVLPLQDGLGEGAADENVGTEDEEAQGHGGGGPINHEFLQMTRKNSAARAREGPRPFAGARAGLLAGLRRVFRSLSRSGSATCSSRSCRTRSRAWRRRP